VPEAVEFVRPVKMLELVGAEGVAPLEYPAQIAATTDAEIAFEVAGLITEFPVVQGQFVNTGDLLAQIDPRDYEAQLDAVRAERNVSLADYRRYQDLYAADAASLQELEVARRRFEVADAQIRSAEKAVADTTLRAPFSGRVARRLLEAFQSVSARQPVLVLQDVQDTLDVIVNVPENDVALSPERAREVVNQAGVVTVLTSFPDQRIPLRFKEFASAADPTTRTFEVTFSFDPPDDMAIMPGMTAKVYVPSASGDGFFVPSNAVVSDTGAPYVWVIDRSDMTVSRREIQVASLSGSEVQVVGGLRSGETVAVSAAQNLTEGMQVREIQY
jgi:RND family efflux transporter MFP subunit